VVGELKEQRYVGFINGFGEQITPGVYHHMRIELLIDTGTKTIEDVVVTLPRVHVEIVRRWQPASTGSKEWISPVVFLQDQEDGRRQQRLRPLEHPAAGHGPAAVQGAWINIAWLREEPVRPDPQTGSHLVDSCWAWRKDGPLVAELGIKVDK